MNKGKALYFDDKQLELLYDACMCYGEQLSTAKKMVGTCSQDILELLDRRMKEAYRIAVSLSES